ncbi:hypothetical protein FBR05_14315 [Deltaproteobacteria bacterium PRO3]|nr:hypothetical protein [Deltaproteobacteria bacterium PRO3]
MMDTVAKPMADPKPWHGLRDALFRPRTFFNALNPEGPWTSPLLFAAALSLLSGAGFAVNDLLFPQGNALWEPWPWYWNLFDWPLILALEFLFLAWFHLVLRWRGGAHHPYRATFRAYCYSAAPNILCLLPLLGIWVAILWGLGLSLYAIKTLQRTTWTRVVTSFLIANALLGLVLFGLVFAAGYFLHYFE